MKHYYRKKKVINHPIKRYRRCAKLMFRLSEHTGVIHAAIFFRSVKQQWLDYFKECEVEEFLEKFTLIGE